MELAEHVDQIVLFSGDGDFRSLVEAVQRRGVRVTMVSTISSQPPMIADGLWRQADVFTDLLELRPSWAAIRLDAKRRAIKRHARPRCRRDQATTMTNISTIEAAERVRTPTSINMVARGGVMPMKYVSSSMTNTAANIGAMATAPAESARFRRLRSPAKETTRALHSLRQILAA
jgi:hypothetical protein